MSDYPLKVNTVTKSDLELTSQLGDKEVGHLYFGLLGLLFYKKWFKSPYFWHFEDLAGDLSFV